MKIEVTSDGAQWTTIVDGSLMTEGRVSWLESLDQPTKLFVTWTKDGTPWQISEGEVWVNGVLMVRVPVAPEASPAARMQALHKVTS